MNTRILCNKKNKSAIYSILLVEDDPIIQAVQQYFLKKIGCEVEVVNTGQLAINHSAEKDYDAMVLDLGLPDIKGEVVLSTIRARELTTKKHLAIITATAHGDESVIKNCYAKGADAAFLKPLSLEILKGTLQKICRLPKG